MSRTRSSCPSTSVGTDLLRIGAALLLCFAVVLPAAGETPRGTEAEASIRIGLPEGTRVSLTPGDFRLTLDLPEGADYPDDFAEASNGLLQPAEVERQGDRLRLRLEVASGRLADVDFDAAGLVLNFESRFSLVEPAADAQDQYVLGPDDVITITVYNHEDLTGVDVINRDGMVTLAHVGEVQAAGLTPRQLAGRLTDVLGAIIVDPSVDVEVDEFRSQWVTVAGELHKNGRFPLRGGTRLKEVLSEAAGFTEYAGEEIKISRSLDNGETRTLVVDRRDYETGRKNPTLRHGDIIEVRRANYCYIDGEVGTPGRVRIERGMTLLRVVAMADGLTDWADRKNIKVRYREDGKKDRVYNIKRILSGRAPDPEILGGEIIIVPKRFL